MIKLVVRHSTVYRYAEPVTLGEHRMMLRPRDSHDLRLVSADLTLSPPAKLRWLHDVFGNSVMHARFAQPTTELRVESTLRLERYPIDPASVAIDREFERYPFIYSADDRTDLGRLLEPHYPDPKGQLAQWAKSFVAEAGQDTRALLNAMNSAIPARFLYQARDQEGTQTPQETLERGAGTCRDFALLMIEALRVLGFGARFVSGYLYDAALDGGDGTVNGAAATHAWLEVYLPGAGWLEFDPTNALVAAPSLIRVAVVRDPSQAIPIAGSFTGSTGAFLGMTVNVEVTRGEAPPVDAAA